MSAPEAVQGVEAAAGTVVERARRVPARNTRRSILMLALGHGAADFYPGYLPAILPFLITKLGMSLTVAGALGTLQSFSTSMIQPVLGYLVDARQPRPYAAWGLATAAVLFALLGMAPSVGAVVLLLIFGGLGVALFHPQGAAMAGKLAGGKAGTAMSVFATGGSIGHALGPLAAVLVVQWWGLDSLLLLAIPGILVALLVHRELRTPLEEMRTERRHGLPLGTVLSSMMGPQLMLLLIVMTLRSATLVGLTSMLPIYLEARGHAATFAALAIVIFRLAGAVGTLLGGPLSDRFGRRVVIWLSFLLSLPFYVLFFQADGVMAQVYLALAAAIMTASAPVNTVMAQETIPRSAAVASGLMMGVGWAIGSLSVFAIGFFGDRMGIEVALPAVTLVLAAAGLLTSMALPRGGHAERQAPEA